MICVALQAHRLSADQLLYSLIWRNFALNVTRRQYDIHRDSIWLKGSDWLNRQRRAMRGKRTSRSKDMSIRIG